MAKKGPKLSRIPLQPLPIAQLSPEAAEAFEKEFCPNYRIKIEQIRQVVLTILVWGPGEPNATIENEERMKLYNKRVQILNTLRAENHLALFSEFVETEIPAPDISAKSREREQAELSDLIIVLYGTPGSIGEVHDFAGEARIAGKMQIFADKRLAKGYGSEGILKQLNSRFKNVETYESPKDLDECGLLTKIVDIVYGCRTAKWETTRTQ